MGWSKNSCNLAQLQRIWLEFRHQRVAATKEKSAAHIGRSEDFEYRLQRLHQFHRFTQFSANGTEQIQCGIRPRCGNIRQQRLFAILFFNTAANWTYEQVAQNYLYHVQWSKYSDMIRIFRLLLWAATTNCETAIRFRTADCHALQNSPTPGPTTKTFPCTPLMHASIFIWPTHFPARNSILKRLGMTQNWSACSAANTSA